MQQSSILTKHNQNSRLRPNSRQRLHQLKKEEQYISETFKIDNFYMDNKFDLHSLKNKIDEIKKRSEKDNPEDSNYKNDRKTIELIPLNNKIQRRVLQQKKQKPRISSSRINQSAQRPRNSANISSRILANKSASKQQEQQKYSDKKTKKTNFINSNKQEISSSRYQSIEHQTDRKNKQLEEEELYGNFRSTIIPKIQNIGRRQSILNGKSQKSDSLRKILNSSRLEPLSSLKKKTTLLKVQKEEELVQFQMNIATLWMIYEKLSQVIKILSFENNSILSTKVISQQFIDTLLFYKETVCSTRLEFIVEIIDNCLEFSHAKTIILARLLQNLSIFYVVLQIIEQVTKPQNQLCSSHLVNFVGISSNNLLLLLRLITLVSVINSDLTLSQNVINIFNVISQFQINSYREQLTSVKDIIVRMEHNNDLLSIIHSKLNSKLATKEYHRGCINTFIKGVLIDRLKEDIQIAGDKTGKNVHFQTKPFFQYSYFIFEYLAFHLHHEGYVGLFPKELETVPWPYLPTKKQFTVILDPAKILVHTGKDKIYIRAHSQIFLFELSQKCNVIFWSDLMPNQIDPIYDLVDFTNAKNQQKAAIMQSQKPQKIEIKRLYKHHCFYDYNSRGELALIKDISRIGCPDNKYIIFDSDMENYYGVQRQKTIIIPWRGEAKDTKLATVLDIVLPFLRESTDLKKGMLLLKPRLEQLLKVKKNGHKKQFL